MKKIKWAEIAQHNSELRFNILSEFLNENGFKNTVEFVAMGLDEFHSEFLKLIEKYDCVRIGSPYASMVMPMFQGQTSEMVMIGAGDCLWRIDKEWRLYAANYFGLRYIIHDKGNLIDLESPILVVGSGAGARMAIAAFIRAGVKKINVTNKFPEQTKEMIASLEKSFFGVQFEFIAEERLVLLPGSNSVLINTTPLSPSNDLLNELYYFNFLKSPGLVIDFTIIPIETPLITEAEQIGVSVVRGYELSSWGDLAWIESYLGKKLDREAYSQKLRDRANAEKFDMAPYRKE